MGGSICLWYLHVFSMHRYFLIFSYYLTVSNGHSLTALKSKEFTLISGSFKWGGPSAFGIYMFSLCIGISLYFLIIWLFRMGTHWLHWKAKSSLWSLAVSNGGGGIIVSFPYIFLLFDCFKWALIVRIIKCRLHSMLWQFWMGRGVHLPLVSTCFLYALVFPYIFLLFDCFEWALIDRIEKCRGHSALWQFQMGGVCHLYLPIIWLFQMGTRWPYWKA